MTAGKDPVGVLQEKIGSVEVIRPVETAFGKIARDSGGLRSVGGGGGVREIS